MRASLLLLLAACGDPLVGGEYPGEVLALLDGTVLVEPGGYQWPEETLRVALFWATDGGGLGTEQHVVASTSFPARYTLELHHPPPAEALFRPLWSDVDLAVGTPLLYEDTNSNGSWDEGVDDILGGSPDIALVWSSETGPPEVNLGADDWFIDLQPGFQRMWKDRPFCAEEGGVTYFPADDVPVDLYIGPYWDWLTDWDCDGDLREWYDICPTAEELETMIADDAEAVEGDPELDFCAEILGLYGPKDVFDDDGPSF